MSENIQDANTAPTQGIPTQPNPEFEPQWVTVPMADASETKVRIFNPPRDFTSAQHTAETGADPSASPTPKPGAEPGAEPNTKPLVILWPGFGVGARYYEPIARELASRGWTVAIGELHGQGESTAKASRKRNWGYHDMASSDFPRTIRAVKRHLNLGEKYPTVMLTHSMGGQVAAAFLARPEARELNVLGFFGVGTGTPYFRGFRGRARTQLRWGSLLMSAVVLLRGYQPPGAWDLGNYGRQARNHILEWTRMAQRNTYKNLAGQDMDYAAAMAKTETNVLLTRFQNDEDCPAESAKNLARLFPVGQVGVEEYPPEMEQLGHNRWAREGQVVANRFEEWVHNLPLNR